MDPVSSFAAEIHALVERSRTTPGRGTVVSVSGADVLFTIGTDPTPLRGRWLGVKAPQAGEVVTFLREGAGHPVVLGATGQDLLSWRSYSPAWTTDGVSPAIGNGTVSGRYVNVGGWVLVEVQLRAGSTTTFGSGVMRFTLPVTAVGNGDAVSIPGHLTDAGAGYAPLTGLVVTPGSSLVPHYHALVGGVFSALTAVTGTAPITLDTGDTVYLSGTYRTA